MQIRHKLVLAFVSVALLVAVTGYVSLIQLSKTTQPLREDIPESIEAIARTSHLDALSQFIRYYDEVLTQSARNYAFTQDKKWEQRYREVEPKLNEMIKEAIEKGDEQDKAFFSSIDKANIALVEMEYKSIKLVNNGRAEDATKILESNNYWDQKKIYEQGLRDYVHRRGVKYDETLMGSTSTVELATKQAQDLTKTSTRIVSIFAAVSLMLAVSIGIYISQSIAKPIAMLSAATIEIGKANLDTQIKIKSNNEIGTLAHSFNTMVSNLRKVTASREMLNKEIAERKQTEEHLKRTHAELQKRISELAQAREATLNMMEDAEQANKALSGEIAARSSAQKTLRRHIKQLNCLYGLSRLIEKRKILLEQIFQETPDLIRSAYQCPDATCVRITFEGIQYKTDNFEKSQFGQYAPINMGGNKAGDIEVYYLGEKPETGRGPFLEGERALLDAVAENLGRTAERKRAAETLRLFRNLIDRSNDSIFVMEPQWGRFLDVNDRACDSLGYTREELLNKGLKDVEESILDDSTWQEHVEKLKHKADLVIEGEHRRKDGTTFYVETSLRLVTREDKDYVVAVARDITKRKQMEETLKDSEEKYRALTENSLTGIFILQDERYVFVNDKFAEIHGYRPEELLGKEFWTLIHPDDRELAAQIRSDRLTGKDTLRRYEIRRVKKDGQIIWCENMIVQTEYMGKPAAMGNIIDITERKRAEQRQDELLEEVESINQELKDFAYIVSHDLKAPLRGIKTLGDWLVTDYADKLDDNGREQMNLLMSRVRRMHNLIDGVLQYSKIGRVKEEKGKLNLNDLVSEVIDTLTPPESLGITVEIKVENELPVIECEETRIIQVFQNLLSNAIKYMDKPRGWIRIGCVEENGFWNFSVADNGPGIEEKHFERIFRIFQTLSPRDEFESTGVGLTIVKKIVELYGGKIWVESKLGQGCTFFFTLPNEEMGVRNAKLEANIVS